ncbi:P1 family peptidase [Sphingosinicella sp. YJ22]|uniref:DmpA family aminopeptidase n=1 Tax=Sphingosinicella sp. YJ22 TaxID=1104780 RepID=UPI001A9CB622|nr:P1 family peptidase [Sphingosinicella sp. YJ22]
MIVTPNASAQDRPRVREAGIAVGVMQPGPLNAITDVAGVRVGHVTLIEGRDIRTGVTAVLPHGGNLFQDKVPAAIAVGNGFGKLMGSTQVAELGEIESPILLTNTLNVPEAAAATIEWTLAQPGNEEVRSVNAIVGETNDGFLNDIRRRRVTIADARRAIEAAREGPVAEGAVGAGTGTVAFGYKGGIGTASRRLETRHGGWTVGVLVQSNYGGALTIDGLPYDALTGRHGLAPQRQGSGDGSIIIVIATDAPLSDRNLERLARRAFLALGRTGSPMTNGSGDYAIAFSTHDGVRRTAARRAAATAYPELGNEAMTPLFFAALEATEEAVLNSMFRAGRMDGARGTIEALPIDEVLRLRRQAR